MLASTSLIAQSNTLLKLWYNKPAGKTWEAALPVGNGRLGAMVYGNVGTEEIQLNESTIWTGSPNRNDNPDALQALPQIRQLIFDGKYAEAQDLAGKTIQTKKSNGQMYQPAGSLFLQFDNQQSYTNYYRDLNLENAVATTRYNANGVNYTRTVFASVPAQVIVVRIVADKVKRLSFSAFLKTLQTVTKFSAGAGTLMQECVTDGHETVPGGLLKFCNIVRVKTDGRISEKDSSLRVSNATTAELYISIATNYVNYHDLSADAGLRAKSYLTNALTSVYPDILKRHIASYKKYFDRVSLDLGVTEASKQPTDVRLKNFVNANDPQFVSLYFQYGRYLLISSSQPGGQPATLQGLWNNKMTPPWDSKYTININTEMNYWPAEKTNLSEMHAPLLQMIKELSEAGQETAWSMYGARGWMAHHNTDLWRITGPVDRIFWGVWSMGGAWLSQHLWEHYLYTGDKQFLETAYPIIKGAALFFLDDLVEDPRSHYLVVNPGTSPENEPRGVPERKGVSLDAGCTMDNQIVFDTFDAAIRAARIINKDAVLADSFYAYQQRLSPMRIGKYGQLQEWAEDLDDPEDKHRHISHLYGLFPSQQISPVRTPELFNAARTTLQQRGDVSTGWSMGWKVNWWARILDGGHAMQLLKQHFQPANGRGSVGGTGVGGNYDNLFDAHPPFQIDGNFGVTSGITEMLLQSYDGVLQPLPALPHEWKYGEIHGIKARGGFEIIEMAWQNGKLSKLIIKSALGGNCRLRLPQDTHTKINVTSAIGANPNPFYYTNQIADPLIVDRSKIETTPLKVTKDVDFATEAGKIYQVL